MIVVDASAVLAIYLNEAERDRFHEALAAAGDSVMSAVNYWEVLAKAQATGGAAGRAEAERLVSALGVTVVAATEEQARSAADAFERWGKRSLARLNLGDCFAYALAQIEGDGLLFKGNDFSKTDIRSALV